VATLNALLRGLPDIWVHRNEGEDTWNAFDIVGLFADFRSQARSMSVITCFRQLAPCTTIRAMFPTPDGAIRVVAFSVEECPKAPTSGPPLFTFEQFHTLRNEILSILSRYGTVGPNGKLCIPDSVERSTEVWAGNGTHNPDFYVVSDIWNYWSRWIRIECGLHLIKKPLLDELAMTLLPLPSWCLYLALKEGGLTVFSNRILFEGPAFAGCSSVTEIYQRCTLSSHGKQ